LTTLKTIPIMPRVIPCNIRPYGVVGYMQVPFSININR
jgi:hypothetical protein